jgi:hypothetical protein
MDREFVIHYYKKFWSRIEAVVEASGNLSNKCVGNKHVNLS